MTRVLFQGIEGEFDQTNLGAPGLASETGGITPKNSEEDPKLRE